MSSVAISVAAGGQDLSSPMDERFGRAAGFLVVDASTGEVLESLGNSASSAAHGAGTGAAALMRDHGVTAVISGRFGPKAHAALSGMGIGAWVAPAGVTAGEALKRFQQGELELMQLRVMR